MSQPRFVSPQSVKEAVTLLSEYKERANILAGGTDLIARIKQGVLVPRVLVNIRGLSELNYVIYRKGEGLRVGALTPLSAIVKSDVVRRKFPVLAMAAGMMASPTIRGRATIGGNLCNAAPSADTAPVLLALGANLKIISLDKEQFVTVEQFFTGPGLTILKPGQLIAEIRVPEMPVGSGASYIKQRRRQGADLAVAGVASLVVMDEGDQIKDIHLALAAVAPTPIRAVNAEVLLRGRKITEPLLAEAGRVSSFETTPIDDVRGSASYRKKLIEVLVPRAIIQAVETAKSKGKA